MGGSSSVTSGCESAYVGMVEAKQWACSHDSCVTNYLPTTAGVKVVIYLRLLMKFRSES